MAVGQRIEAGAHLTVRHLYVLDGDLPAQDQVAAEQAAGVKANAADPRSSAARFTSPPP